MIEGQATIVRPEDFEYYKSNDLNIYKGKKIAYVHTAEAEYIFKDALDKAGIDWKKDVTWLEFSSPTEVVEAVNKKTADVGFSWPPHYSLAVKTTDSKFPLFFRMAAPLHLLPPDHNYRQTCGKSRSLPSVSSRPCCGL